MYIDRAGTIDMKRVNFRGNRACGSGGMFVRGGSTKLVMKGPFFFEGNTASGCAGVGVNVGRSIGGQGGGLSLSGVSGAMIEGGSFSRNVGKVGGGGMGISTYDERNAVVVTSTSIMGCLFDSNNARLFGGGYRTLTGRPGPRLSACHSAHSGTTRRTRGAVRTLKTTPSASQGTSTVSTQQNSYLYKWFIRRL